MRKVDIDDRVKKFGEKMVTVQDHYKAHLEGVTKFLEENVGFHGWKGK